VVEQQRLDTGGGEDRGGVDREVVGVVARVVPDRHAGDRLGISAHGADLVEEVGRETGCGADDDRAVHAVRPRGHGAAQPGGAELEQP